jgi:hypothetical protein
MVTITVKRKGEAVVSDLEVSPELPISKLAVSIAHEMGWDVTNDGSKIEFAVEVYPPGRILNDEETLDKAGIEDGSWLVFSPRGKYAWKRVDED